MADVVGGAAIKLPLPLGEGWGEVKFCGLCGITPFLDLILAISYKEREHHHR